MRKYIQKKFSVKKLVVFVLTAVVLIVAGCEGVEEAVNNILEESEKEFQESISQSATDGEAVIEYDEGITEETDNADMSESDIEVTAPEESRQTELVENAPVFTKSEIPEKIRQSMQGVTISENSKVTFENLAYLTITHIGYDGKPHTGNMVVNKKLADEVLVIFEELYRIKFPIERMELVYNYGGSDELSMRANNTSSFNDRPVSGGTGLSYHQLGQAIDINPLVNPYVKKSVVLPETAREYTDRTLDAQGMINLDSECVKIFKKYGWDWGGDWKSLKDYQHFEKR